MCISETRQAQLGANILIDRACTGNGGNCTAVAVVDVEVELSPSVRVTLRLCLSHGIQVTQRGLRNGVTYATTKLD